MTLLAVNFHYVREPADRPARAIFPIGPGELSAFAVQLARSFTPVSRDQVIAAATGGTPLPSRACLLTFDDGLREQVEVGLPVLDELGIPAVVFVSGAPLAEGSVLRVHKLHAVRESLDPAAFVDALRAGMARGGIEAPAVDPSAAQAMYRYDAPESAEVKYLLNVVLPREDREPLVDAIFAEVFGDERGFSRDLYVDEQQVASLERRGALGSHTWSHVPLRQLDDEQLLHEFGRNAEFLARLAGASPVMASYPYGGTDAVDRRVADAAAAVGHRVAFTMERALNLTLADPLLLARLDWLDAPGGRRPLPAVDGRSRYLREA